MKIFHSHPPQQGRRLWLCGWLLCVFAVSAAAQLVESKKFVSMQPIAPTRIAAGAEAEVTVVVVIKERYHLQDRQAKRPYIPTAFTLEKSEGVTVGEVKFPPTVEFRFYGEKLQVYEGELPLKIPLRIASNAAPGARELRGRLHVQACDTTSCYQPSDIEIKIPIEITTDAASAAAPVAPATESPRAETPTTAPPVADAKEAGIDWKNYTPEELERAARERKPAMLDFTAEWCIPCQELEHKTFPDARVIALSRKFAMLKVDLTAKSAAGDAASQKFSVPAPPLLIFFDSQGKETGRVAGFVEAEELVAQMEKTLAGQRVVQTGLGASLADQLQEALRGGRFWLAVVVCFLGGLALNLTPCVYPMIAITVSVFGGQSRKSAGESFGFALAYFLGVVVTYTTLGLVSALTGSFFGTLLQQPIVLIGIAAILVALALAMFGLYEFQPPQFLMQRASGWGSKSGYAGMFSLGAVMGIIAAPCVGPFVLGLLSVVAALGDWARGGLLFLALSTGLALPYLVLGTFSSLLTKLPKSGGWMKAVKVIFGLVLLAMAAWFVSPLFK